MEIDLSIVKLETVLNSPGIVLSSSVAGSIDVGINRASPNNKSINYQDLQKQDLTVLSTAIFTDLMYSTISPFSQLVNRFLLLEKFLRDWGYL